MCNFKTLHVALESEYFFVYYDFLRPLVVVALVVARQSIVGRVIRFIEPSMVHLVRLSLSKLGKCQSIVESIVKTIIDPAVKREKNPAQVT